MLTATVRGSADAPTVVWLHGGGVAGWMWRRQLEALPELHSLAPDLPGHGKSRDTPWAGIGPAAAAVGELIRARANRGRAHVVGLSLGGHVALQLVADYPDLVDRIVISGTLVTGLSGARSLARVAGWLLPLGRTRLMTELSARALRVPPEDREIHRAEAMSLTDELLRRTVLDVADYRPPAVLATRPHAVLVVAGTREHRRVRASVTVLAAMLPHATGGLVPGAIHTWNWQRPDAFTRMIRDWLLLERAPAELQSC